MFKIKLNGFEKMSFKTFFGVFKNQLIHKLTLDLNFSESTKEH